MSINVKFGFGNTVKYNAPQLDVKSSTVTKGIFSSRVRDIILDNTHPRFDEFGEWNGIGTIFIEPTTQPSIKNKIPLIPAFPAFPNIKHYPLLNELVPVIYLADPNVTEDTSAVSAYYLPPINVWNSQVHNAVPSTNITPELENKEYPLVEAGSVRRVTDQDTDIELGKTFNENNVLNNRPLLSYEGDIIYEGRFGNSIRFGSTVNNAKLANPWSFEGKNGSPIIIIKNGQSTETDASQPWVPTVENINIDESSIYLTSTQQIPLELSTENLDSYDGLLETPTIPELYSGKQILLNSGRLVFNAKNDHIILSADKSVHLVSNNSLNFDTTDKISMTTNMSFGKITLTSPKIHLGLNEGTEGYVGSELQSLVLGENLIQTLSSIIDALDGVAKALYVATATGAEVSYPIVSLNKEGIILGGQVTLLKDSLNILLSKSVKTI
jgi:hypothetical protein